MKSLDQLTVFHKGGGLGHFLDPLGITPVGKGKGGGAKNAWDPLGLFTGGSGSSQAAAIASAPVPTPAPPATMSSSAVIQAEHDFAQQNLLKKSIKKTVIAGDTQFNPAGLRGPAGSGPNPFVSNRGKF